MSVLLEGFIGFGKALGFVLLVYRGGEEGNYLIPYLRVGLGDKKGGFEPVADVTAKIEIDG